ncbi:MAG: aminotransferase class V-fold PLP-dependent enzyme [Candidatus Nanoarchaeia archaeon]|nr:aminotransferase class V-fold PLP-dependent enzyme [Candidatus Nanoarchaeia archaeon]
MNKFDFNQISQINYLDNLSISIIPQNILIRMNDIFNCTLNDIDRYISFETQANNEYLKSKEIVAEFLNCNREEIIYTKNTTESINILAYGLTKNLEKGDEIILSQQEHDSNFLIWQKIAKEKDLKINLIKHNSNGEIDINDLKFKINQKTKIASISGCSSILGYLQDLEGISNIIKEKNKDVFINYDLASYIPFRKVDLKKINADSICFSAQKLYSPIVMGILFINEKSLSHFEEILIGSNSVSKITKNDYLLYKDYNRLEYGTKNIIGAIALGYSINYLEELGYENIEENNKKIIDKFLKYIKNNKKLNFINIQDKNNKAPIFSFTLDNIPNKRFVETLRENDIICSESNFGNIFFLSQNNIESVIRFSFGLFVEESDIDNLISVLDDIL